MKAFCYLVFSTFVAFPLSAQVVVPGMANPWLAPSGSVDNQGDRLPDEAPVLALTPVTPGHTLTFDVTGSVSYGGGAATDSPDGNDGFGVTHPAQNGLGAVNAPANALMGVFINTATPADPSNAHAPAELDFYDPTSAGVAGGRNYPTLAPQLNQVFFIGDGKINAGQLNGNYQQITVPADANAIYLGSMDGSGWYNNSGQFNVTLYVNGSPPTQQPSDLRVGQNATVSGTDNASVALIGDQITYTFTVRNFGPGTARNVQVVNTLPSKLHFVSADHGGTAPNAPADPQFGGGVVTWSLGDLPPTDPNAPIILKLVTSIIADAPINSVIINKTYGISADGVPTINGRDINDTTVKAPLAIDITSNAATVSPGGTVEYRFKITNSGQGKVKGIDLNLPLPQNVLFVKAIAADAGFQEDIGSKNSISENAGNIEIQIKKLGSGDSAYFLLTVAVPYDVDPAQDVSLPPALITTVTAVGGLNRFAVEVVSAKLSGAPPANPPHFSLVKFIPDGTTIFQLLTFSDRARKYFTKAFPGIASEDGIKALGAAVNPDVIDTTDGDGFFQQAVIAPKQPGGPGKTQITYALLFSNDGGFEAVDTVLTDRIPAGTKLDRSEEKQPTLNGKPFASGAVTVEDDGRTIHFPLDTVKPDKPGKASLGLVLYTVSVEKPGKGGPSIGASIQAQGGSLRTQSLLATAFATPAEINTRVVAPGAAFIESYKTVSQSVVGAEIAFDTYYRNTGGVDAADFRIVDPIPAGTTFVAAELLDINRNPAGPAAGPVNGAVTFDIGKLKPGKDGWVRLRVSPNGAALTQGNLAIEHDPYVPADVFPANAQAAAGKNTRAAQGGLAFGRSLSRVYDSRIPRVAAAVVAPLSVKAGDTFDVLVSVANLSDTLLGTPTYLLTVPAGATFVSSSQANAYVQNFEGVNVVTFKGASDENPPVFFDVAPHSAITRKVTFRAETAAAGSALVTNLRVLGYPITLDGVVLTVPDTNSGRTSTYVFGAGQSFADASSQIVSSALEISGSAAASITQEQLQKRIAALTPQSAGNSIGGADLVTFANNTNGVPLGAGNALVFGSAANIVAQGGGNLITNDGASIIAQGGGNLIRIANLITNDGGSLIGNDGASLQSIFAGIVAQGAGNIVAQGGGNIYNAGGLNLISNDGASLITNDGGSLVPIGPQLAAGIVAAGAGNIVAQGGGNIVAQGGGNIVAQGGGNLLSLKGGSLINLGGGASLLNGRVFSSSDVSSAISASASSLVNITGGNIVAAGAGN